MTVGRAAGQSDLFGSAEAAERLAALAAEPRMSPRADQLRGLAGALESGTGLERWAVIDLYAAFLRDDTVAEPDDPGGARGTAAAVRDLAPSVLIFMPIMLTWLGLFKATSAYRRSRGDADLAGMSFLEQWQTGFDGRLGGWFYFDRIALGTLLLICLLITVTVAEMAARRRSERAGARERTRLTRELAAALTAADLHLGRYRVDDASRVEEAARRLEDAAEEARRAGESAAELQRETNEAVARARAGFDRLERLAEALLAGDEAVRDATGKIGAAAAAVGGRVDALASATVSVAGAAAELTRASADGAELLGKAVEDAADRLRTAAAQDRAGLGDRIAEALDSGSTAIRAALDDWRTDGAIYSHRHEMTADHLGAVVGSVEELLLRMDGSIRELMDGTTASLGRLPGAVDALDEHARLSVAELQRTLTAATGEIRAELDRLLTGLPEADGRTAQVTAELARLRASMDALRDRLADGGRRRWFR
ncbi:coiled-coil domain-containing protein [Actinomadura algeriensis]|uniref:Methyl-accepting chemotaxis protein n=1 Tax=Actinomadura algeriensis TaxID=1679523 RepID=A0ABR9K4P7_9ACTN|nr:hypothetical protein [Actinomadura algeriensis]MBE1537599.1 hypothetical protein [Actinomadura algeriensis]